MPIKTSARNAVISRWLDDGLEKLPDDGGDSVNIPADYKGDFVTFSFTAPAKKIYTVIVNHEAATAPNINLQVGGVTVDAAKRSPTQTRWEFTTGQKDSLPSMQIRHAGGAPFLFKNFSMGNEDIPPQ